MTQLLVVERPRVPEKLIKPVNELLKFIGKSEEPTPLAKLPKELSAIAVLAAADRSGWIEFGTRNHASYGVWKWTNAKNEKRTKDHGDCTADTKTTAQELHIEDGWSFSSMCGPKRKPLAEVIKEYQDDTRAPELQLHVRLTTDGHIQAAGD